MLKKMYSDTEHICHVTFELLPDVGAQTVCICGEFNGWNTSTHPMEQQTDGSFTLTLALQPKKAYRFRYLLDGTRWENERAADDFVPNPYHSYDSLVQA